MTLIYRLLTILNVIALLSTFSQCSVLSVETFIFIFNLLIFQPHFLTTIFNLF